VKALREAKKGPGRRKMTEEMIEYIGNQTIVKKWAGLSLDKRVVMLHR
jgi:hypothetical protein